MAPADYFLLSKVKSSLKEQYPLESPPPQHPRDSLVRTAIVSTPIFIKTMQQQYKLSGPLCIEDICRYLSIQVGLIITTLLQ